MDNASIGVMTAVLIDGVDATRVLNTLNTDSPADAVDGTTFRPEGYSREFIQGLGSATLRLGGFLPYGLDTVLGLMDQAIGNKRLGQEILAGVGGLSVGNLAVMAKSLQTTTSTPIGTDGIITSAAEFVNGKGGVRLGHVLMNLHGSQVAGVNEVQVLTASALADGSAVSIGDGSTGGTNEVQTIASTVPVVLDAQNGGTQQTITPGDTLASIQTKLALAKNITNGHIVAAGTSVAGVSATNLATGKTFTSVTAGTVTTPINNAGDMIDGNTGTSATASDQQARASMLDLGAASVITSVVATSPETGGIAVYGTNNADGNTGRVLLANFASFSNLTPVNIASLSATPFRYITVEFALSGNKGISELEINGSTPGNLAVTATFSGASVANTSQTLFTTATGGVTIARTATGAPAAGTVSLTSLFTSANGTTVTAQQIKSKLESIPAIGVNNVFVTGSAVYATSWSGAFRVMYQGALAGLDIAPLVSSNGAFVVTTDTNGGGKYNLLTASGNQTAVKNYDTPTTFGGEAMLQVTSAVGAGRTLSMKIQHAPDVAGAPGTFVDLLTFDPVTTPRTVARKAVPSGTVINPWIRARIETITGSFVASVAFGRNYS